MDMNELMVSGVQLLDPQLSTQKLRTLHEKIKNSRPFDNSIFMSEEDFINQKNHFNANPNKSFNHLNNYKNDLLFIEENPTINKALEKILGSDYEIILKKIVCGLPSNALPSWVKKDIDGENIANLGPYLKQEYRDITYFRGIDFHQDIIDYPRDRTELDSTKFITLYIYLHDVSKSDSPLHILKKSHLLGATTFPHKLTAKEKKYLYTKNSQEHMLCEDFVLTGNVGLTGIWHNCTLHGTQPIKDESQTPRISLRYLLSKSSKNKDTCLIDTINKNIGLQSPPAVTQTDCDNNGRATYKRNIINKI